MFGAYKKDAINIPHSLQVGALQPRDWGPVIILSFPEFSLSTALDEADASSFRGRDKDDFPAYHQGVARNIRWYGEPRTSRCVKHCMPQVSMVSDSQQSERSPGNWLSLYLKPPLHYSSTPLTANFSHITRN